MKNGEVIPTFTIHHSSSAFRHSLIQHSSIPPFIIPPFIIPPFP